MALCPSTEGHAQGVRWAHCGPMKTLFALTLLAAAASAQAGVNCKFGGAAINVSESLADLSHSPSGKRDLNGKLSLFRLVTLDESEGDTNSIELKTADVTKPGDYVLSLEPGWRSSVDVRGKREKVSGGKFHFTHFEVRDSVGRAAGTVEFTSETTRGVCTFDVPVQAMNRDRLGL
jgi:hypothetical protein